MKRNLQLMTNNPINGICLVNKPSGITSHDVVYKARKIFKTKAIGHTGTLDPLASGLLILTIENANKLSNYLMDGEKGYEAQIKIGIETDTFDRTGKTISEKDFSKITEDKLKSEILNLQGKLTLKVPSFSAVKVDGKKLYELARNNEEVPVVIREMDFHGVEIIKMDLPFVTVNFKCSKGAYVRSWIQELGQKLGTGATMWELKRDFNAPYEISQSIELEGNTLEEILASDAFIPFEKTLSNWPRLTVNEKELGLLKNGCLARSLENTALKAIKATETLPKGIFIVDPETEKVISFLEVLGPFQIKIKKVFVVDSNLDSSQKQE
ncbi:MAG: tRNA pseudouridine(55) synthase TruB [Bdellovibrionota bacterium]